MKLMHCLPHAALSILLVACDSGSPQKTFEAAKLAIEKKDYKALAACLDPDSQAKLISAMIFMAGFAIIDDPDPAKEKDLNALLKKHGMRDVRYQSMKMWGPEFGKVKDKPGMYAELIAFLEKHDDRTGLTVAHFHELKKVKVEGDSATGTLVVKKKDGKLLEANELSFNKIDGKWLISNIEGQWPMIMESEPEKKK